MIELREHQKRACDLARPILDKRGVVLLALQQRLGKTLCALTLANEARDGGKVLFVTKKAAIPSILADSEAMGGWGDSLVVCNYESLHKLNMGFSVVVLDEAHRLSAFPKPSKAPRQVRAICAGAAKVIMLSGTPAIESSAQWFHIFWATALGPWRHYGGGVMSFYKWFKDYGVPKTIRIAGGQEVNDYSEVKSIVADEVMPFAVSMTQEEVGFRQQAQVIPHYIADHEALRIGARLKNHGIIEMDGREVVAETPAAILQKSAMACGGTMIDDEGEPVRRDDVAKLRYLIGKLTEGRQYAIFTQYIEERGLVSDALRNAGFGVTTSMDDFRAGGAQCFVGSIKRYCEGVDLSWMDGAMILYSLTWSGSTYSQILDRMANWDRVEPIKVHVLLVKDSVEEQIFSAISSKQAFNAKFYKDAKNA